MIGLIGVCLDAGSALYIAVADPGGDPGVQRNPPFLAKMNLAHGGVCSLSNGRRRYQGIFRRGNSTLRGKFAPRRNSSRMASAVYKQAQRCVTGSTGFQSLKHERVWLHPSDRVCGVKRVIQYPKLAKIRLRAAIFAKIFWGGMPPDPPSEGRLRAGRLRRLNGTPPFEVLHRPLIIMCTSSAKNGLGMRLAMDCMTLACAFALNFVCTHLFYTLLHVMYY